MIDEWRNPLEGDQRINIYISTFICMDRTSNKMFHGTFFKILFLIYNRHFIYSSHLQVKVEKVPLDGPTLGDFFWSYSDQ